MLSHGGTVLGEPGSYVGNVLYDLEPSHRPALVALLALPVLVRWMRRNDHRPAVAESLVRYRHLGIERQVLCWSVLGSAVSHLALVLGHGRSWWSALFALDAVLLGLAARAVLHGTRRAGRAAGLLLAGNLLALALTTLTGTMPDQIAMAVALVQLLGLLALWSPSTARRRVAGTAAAGGVALLLALATWVTGLAGGAAHHVRQGAVPLGAMIRAHEDRPATPAQAQAASVLHARTAAGIARYADPEVARRAGYRVGVIRGLDAHVDNPGYRDDHRILDPTRPETLVYAAGPTGPVLLGAMFQMPGIGRPGPEVAGPLVGWHAHEQVCLGSLPVGLAGLTDPFGVCPAGSVTVPVTNEMVHVWTVPGAPERFGDLPDGWVKRYLAALPRG